MSAASWEFARPPQDNNYAESDTLSGTAGNQQSHPSHPDWNNTEDDQHQHRRRRPRDKIQSMGKKLGGALSKVNAKVNVIKWIGDLEQDQHLADQLDQMNAENMDEQERQEIRRQATEACMTAIRDHLLEFLQQHPQATYEEWICQLHPDNINVQMQGLTSTPLIDHRFYVADSDHRILWNEHLNDLNNPNSLTPVRHFVEARTFNHQQNAAQQQQQPQTDTTSASNNGSLIELVDMKTSAPTLAAADNGIADDDVFGLHGL